MIISLYKTKLKHGVLVSLPVLYVTGHAQVANFLDFITQRKEKPKTLHERKKRSMKHFYSLVNTTAAIIYNSSFSFNQS